MLKSRFGTLLLCCLVARVASSQTVTGSIIGSVNDTSGSVIAGAHVAVSQVTTGATRQTMTDPRGDFAFNGLAAGEYTLMVRMEGFRPAERRRVVLSTGERLALNGITLELGAVTDQVTVAAEVAPLQTASSERSGLITSSQVDNLLIKGRNVMSLLQLLPGVVDPADNDAITRNWSLNVNGNRGNMNNLTLDGLSLINVGGGQGHVVQVGQDTIAEVKILLSNYQAEYGMMAGANVSLLTKSGTRDFHGLGSWFRRHEQFNANNFFSNRLNQAKPRSRYNVWNYNVGGPVYIPGKFNQNRDKLFFFWSQEFWPTVQPQAPRQVTVPTELERAGDFSQSLDVNNRLVVVSDPLNNRQPFPDNRIPSSRIDPNGQALLNVFPAPNMLDRGISRGNYNYAYQTENRQSQKINLLKLDYHLNSNNIISGTSAAHTEEYEGFTGLPTSGSTNWPQMQKTYAVNSRTYQVRHQSIFSPTLINELSLGHVRLNGRDEVTDAELQRNQRAAAGFGARQLYPGSNPLGVLPNVTFDVPNAANLALEGRFPFTTRQYRMDLSDNLTKTAGAHTLKAGLLVDRVWSSPSLSTSFNGDFNFSRSANNPLDSGYSYANAILGNFLSYSESSRAGRVHVRSLNVEWFVQDNWKVNRQLTLDYGIRFSLIRPLYERDNLVSTFSPAFYDAAQQVRLIAPALVGGQRVGMDSLTGVTYPQALIGALVPGSGNPANGMVAGYDGTYPRGLADDRGVHYAPRVGFAWDVLGRGRTAIRGGFGTFYNRPSFDSLLTGGFATQLPVIETPMLVNTTLGSIGSASGSRFPTSVLGLDRAAKVPTVMNFSLSVQQNIGLGTVIDIGYTGSLGRHLMWARDLNTIPAGANFRPENADPSNRSVPLASAFLRPVPGYQSILMREWAASSNYHSLQASAVRRYTRGMQFGASWTWSKAMDYNDGDTETVSQLVPVRVWNYGLASFDRTHTLKLNWIWDLPKAPVRATALKLILNEWQVSGIASFVSGSPLGIGYSTVSPTDITGTPSQGARVDVIDNPVLPKSERTFSRNFRTDVFRLPSVGTFGTAARTLVRGPGINNWDVAVFKNFPVRENMRLQLRVETYNTFNHTQFASMDTTARFDAAGNQVNTRLGEFISARNPRQMQMALRFYF